MPTLFLSPIVTVIDEILRERGVDGVVAVSQARLGRKLASRGYRIAPLPLGDGEAVAVVASLARVTDWQAEIATWQRVVKGGGVVVLVDRRPAHQNAGRALCGGLTDVAQRRAGRYVVTAAVVPAAA